MKKILIKIRSKNIFFPNAKIELVLLLTANQITIWEKNEQKQKITNTLH